MSFSKVFPKKTSFPPTSAILAPLPVTSGTWRWSVEILIYVCASYIAFFLRFHVFFYHFSLKNAISAYLRHFCATSGDVNCWLALISRLSNRRRFPASCPTPFFFISMSFSTIFPQKTPFPPTCAICAPLAMTSGNWRWSSDYLKDIGVPLLPPYFFSMSF